MIEDQYELPVSIKDLYESLKDENLSGAELTKKQLEKELGIPYSEFEMLDLDEQHKLIESKTGKEIGYDCRLYIDAIPMDDNHIITRKQADKRIEKITATGPKKLLLKFSKVFKRK